jgi:hypothetical protein
MVKSKKEQKRKKKLPADDTLTGKKTTDFILTYLVKQD